MLVTNVVRVDVCQGGACMRNGGQLLLAATEALASSAASTVAVRPTSCCSVCPSTAVICRADGAASELPSSSLKEALESAATLLSTLIDVDSSLMAAYEKKADGEAALLDSRPAAAVAALTEALETQPEPPYAAAQEPIPPERLEWEGSTWFVSDAREAFGSDLTFEDSATSYEFGRSDSLVLTDCAIEEDEDEGTPTLTGYFEGEEGVGEVRLLMSSDGRSFDGHLTWEEDGSTEMVCPSCFQQTCVRPSRLPPTCHQPTCLPPSLPPSIPPPSIPPPAQPSTHVPTDRCLALPPTRAYRTSGWADG